MLSAKPRGTTNIVEEIYLDLRHRILVGELKPGARLSGERELAGRYKTNRNTLREAIRKLEHAKLVKVRHGQGVTVADFRRSGTLELIGPFLAIAPDPGESMRVLLDLLTARLHILEMAVSLAAQRADAEDTARLRHLAQAQTSLFDAEDRSALVHGELGFVEALVDASHSLAVRWIANTLLEVYRGLTEPITELWVLEKTYPAYLRDLLYAIERHDAKLALEATRDYYARADERLLKMLELPEPPPARPGRS